MKTPILTMTPSLKQWMILKTYREGQLLLKIVVPTSKLIFIATTELHTYIHYVVTHIKYIDLHVCTLIHLV